MLRRLREFKNWNVSSIDGHHLGRIEDFYFDDEQWTVRYLVAKTGSWFAGCSVLQSPIAIARVRSETETFELQLRHDQIESATAADQVRPVSREWETTHAGYHDGLPPYWVGPGVGAAGAIPVETRSALEDAGSAQRALVEEQHLRSARDVAGYHIQARDGKIGHVDDFVVNDETWTIRYLLVHTTNWAGGRSVIIAAGWAEGIDRARREVVVDVSRQVVRGSPQYEPGALVTKRCP